MDPTSTVLSGVETEELNMHGVKRSRISPQAAEAKRQKEQAKLEAYTRLQQDVASMKQAKLYTSEALQATNKLLDLNPEYYTIWNYRRQILINGLFPESKSADIVGLLSNEIRLTTAYLHVHPKVYWIWTHRRWCLENVPLGPGEPGSGAGKEGEEGWRNEFWKVELRMLEAMLDADARNFHAWDYRRYVIASLPRTFSPPRTAADELKYTQKKIESSFSNFSAWHLRTKLLGGLWEDMAPEEVMAAKDKEFELVTQALWTDPGDQSGWLYHRWLIGSKPDLAVLRREYDNVKELLEQEPDSKWCMNALAHYALLLAETQDEDDQALRAQAKELYTALERADRDRRGRYLDMAKAIPQ